MRWFGMSFAPKPKYNERFARRYRNEPSPEFSLTLPCSGIIHQIAGVDTCALVQTVEILVQAELAQQPLNIGTTVFAQDRASSGFFAPPFRVLDANLSNHRFAQLFWQRTSLPNRLRPRWTGRKGTPSRPKWASTCWAIRNLSRIIKNTTEVGSGRERGGVVWCAVLLCVVLWVLCAVCCCVLRLLYL